MLRGVKRIFAFQQICSFDPDSSIKLLASKIEKVFPLSVVQFYPGRSCHHLRRVQTHQLRQLRQLCCTNICDISNEKVLVNISHRSCTRNGNHLVLLIKTSSTQNEKMISQTVFCSFKRGRGSNTIKKDGCGQMVVDLTITEMS